MVWIPKGDFKTRFAVGQYEVTFAEYDKFAEDTNKDKPSDKGWGRDNRPVINVSWHDANDYAKWLSKQTGYIYRLPTEAEWAYAARAGTTTHYWWGNDIGTNNANCDGCGSKWDNQKTAPVGSFAANNFHIYDTVGNVLEWCSDKYSNGLSNIIPFGSWTKSARYNASSVCRNYGSPDDRYLYVGFRLWRQP